MNLHLPISLSTGSTIMDPSDKSAHSKMERFQVDEYIPSKFHPPSVWQKLHSSLLNAMSNFVVFRPVLAFTSFTPSVNTMSYRSTNLSFLPWKSFKFCKLSISEEIVNSMKKTPMKSDSGKFPLLYHSFGSGLECLRYFATCSLQPEEEEHKQSAQTQALTRHYFDCPKLNAFGFPIAGGGGALCFPLILSSTECTARDSLSAHHHYQHQTWKPVVLNLFPWAMTGFLQYLHFDSLYKNHCVFSPVHVKATESSQKLSGNVENLSSSSKAKAEGSIEIFIHSSSSPTKTNNSSAAANNSGYIRIETNWVAVNETGSRAHFDTRSLCSSTSSLNAGVLTFSRSSVGSSLRPIMSAPRPIPTFKTECKSSASIESTDSFCIVFESAPGCIDKEGDPREIDDEEWEEEDDENDDSDDDDDQIFNYSSTSDDISIDGCIFEVDGIDLGGSTSCDQVDLCGERTIPNKQHKKKTVSFDEEHLEVIVEFEDDFESKSCRETHWEMVARDRTRFQERILRTGDILESILQAAHRLQVYNQRLVKTEESQLN